MSNQGGTCDLRRAKASRQGKYCKGGSTDVIKETGRPRNVKFEAEDRAAWDAVELCELRLCYSGCQLGTSHSFQLVPVAGGPTLIVEHASMGHTIKAGSEGAVARKTGLQIAGVWRWADILLGMFQALGLIIGFAPINHHNSHVTLDSASRLKNGHLRVIREVRLSRRPTSTLFHRSRMQLDEQNTGDPRMKPYHTPKHYGSTAISPLSLSRYVSRPMIQLLLPGGCAPGVDDDW